MTLEDKREQARVRLRRLMDAKARRLEQEKPMRKRHNIGTTVLSGFKPEFKFALSAFNKEPTGKVSLRSGGTEIVAPDRGVTPDQFKYLMRQVSKLNFDIGTHEDVSVSKAGKTETGTIVVLQIPLDKRRTNLLRLQSQRYEDRDVALEFVRGFLNQLRKGKVRVQSSRYQTSGYLDVYDRGQKLKQYLRGEKA